MFHMGAHFVKTWRHPQNRKYTTYRNATRGGPSHCHSRQAQKFSEVRPWYFWDMQVDRLAAIASENEGQTDHLRLYVY